MSTAQRALFVLLALAAAAGAGYVLLSSEDVPQPQGFDLGRPGERPASAGTGSRSATPGLGAPALRSAAPSDEEDPDGTSLTVLVVDDRGRPLPEATVELVSEEGARVEGRGSLEWLDATPGTWALRVEAEGLLPFRREVLVEAGARARVTAQLRDHVRLVGRVTDLFGRPVESQTLWLLAEGRAHPAKKEKPRDVPFDSTDRLGEFELRAEKEGTYRVSVGKIGEAIATSAPFDLHLGGPEELEVVVAAGGTLLVELEDPPQGLAESRAILRVSVLKRRKNLVPSVGSAETERRRRRDGARRGRAGAAGTETDPAAGEEAPPAAELEPWKEVAIVELDSEGRAQLDGLPVGPDLRLVFHRQKDRYESATTFALAEGRPLRARFSLPARRTKEEIAARPAGTLYATVLADPDAARAGIRLVE